MKSKPKFTIVRCDDWEGLYVDGILVYEDHKVPIDQILVHMGQALQEFRIDESLNAHKANGLPEKLSDVVPDA